jgi:hypothetical protein
MPAVVEPRAGVLGRLRIMVGVWNVRAVVIAVALLAAGCDAGAGRLGPGGRRFADGLRARCPRGHRAPRHRLPGSVGATSTAPASATCWSAVTASRSGANRTSPGSNRTFLRRPSRWTTEGPEVGDPVAAPPEAFDETVVELEARGQVLDPAAHSWSGTGGFNVVVALDDDVDVVTPLLVQNDRSAHPTSAGHHPNSCRNEATATAVPVRLELVRAHRGLRAHWFGRELIGQRPRLSATALARA